MAGGAALIARGIVDRVTEDLDYFTDETSEAVSGLADAVEGAAAAEGLEVQVTQSGHGFVRLEIRAGRELCQVDLAHDARIRQQERSEVGPVLALEELGADKVLALFARAEARDFV
ncbi:MAG: nucleotidyl transferase AbiEii/AbiGii toxin family protein, partial [Euzebyales bacterium]|nr:nucleotidyl transferase AbiEii/AbiGii toxin family protein [Euzebyales bacterium]